MANRHGDADTTGAVEFETLRALDENVEQFAWRTTDNAAAEVGVVSLQRLCV